MELLINIDVPQLAAGVTFYEQGLGFTFRRYLFQRSVGEMFLGPLRIFLIEQAEGAIAVAGSTLSRAYEDHWTPIHLDLVVEDLPDRVERALRAGARAFGGVSAYDWGLLQRMRDPFGHGFCLIAFHGSDYLVE